MNRFETPLFNSLFGCFEFIEETCSIAPSLTELSRSETENDVQNERFAKNISRKQKNSNWKRTRITSRILTSSLVLKDRVYIFLRGAESRRELKAAVRSTAENELPPTDSARDLSIRTRTGFSFDRRTAEKGLVLRDGESQKRCSTDRF